MSNESNLGPLVTETADKIPATQSTEKKHRSSRRGQDSMISTETPTDAIGLKVTSAKSRRFTGQERAEKLQQIAAQVSAGTSTLKDAIKNAGISEQTFYLWKRAARSVNRKDEPAKPVRQVFADLLELEKENLRLCELLAEKLNEENAQLRTKLGLD